MIGTTLMYEQVNIEIPSVLFLVFNRPALTERVMHAIKKARPRRLYVAADGPRQDHPDDVARCEEVRRIVSNIDWPCEVYTLFRENNLGCRLAVSSAIDWFFERETEGIILEDDCLPELSFFAYCAFLLRKYRNDERIMCISGDNPLPAKYKYSYWYTKFPLIWGWATWKRAWKKYNFKSISSPNRYKILKSINASPEFVSTWIENLDWNADTASTWDYAWVYCIWENRGLTCVPSVNLISNIGFGDGATHTISSTSSRADSPVSPMTFPIQSPRWIRPNKRFDQLVIKHLYGIQLAATPSILHRVLRRLKQRIVVR